MRTTAKTLQSLVNHIAKLTNKATSYDEAKNMGLTHYLWLEHNSAYGGYRLINVSLENGSHSGVFGGNGCEPRLKARDMENKLNSLIVGLEYKKG